MVLGTFIIVILLSSAYLVKRYNQNCLTMGLYVVPSFIGTIVLMTVKNTDTATKAGLLISYYSVLSFWAAQTLSMSMISRNVAGQTKKSIVVSMNFISWCTGNAIGEWNISDSWQTLLTTGQVLRSSSNGIRRDISSPSPRIWAATPCLCLSLYSCGGI